MGELRNIFGIILLAFLIANISGLTEAGYYVQVFPQPKVFKCREKPIGLPRTLIIKCSGPEHPVKSYIVDLLSNKFQEILNFNLAAKEQTNRYLTVISLKIEKGKIGNPEGYEIGFDVKGKIHTLTVKSSSYSGLLYGSWRLIDVVLESTRQAGRLSVPSDLMIRDEPTMKTRLLPTVVDKINKNSLARLDWLARWGINGIWITTFAPERNIREISTEAKKRAITLYGMLSFRKLSRIYKRPLCPSDSSDRKIIYTHFEKAARAGCGGFAFLFDDLEDAALNHYKTCSKCKGKLNSLAEIQVEFLKIMVEVAKKYHINEDKLIMCPTPYRSWWIDKYKLPHNYFEIISSSLALKNVKIFHTDLYYDVIKSLEKIGLKRYIWWNNGLWTTTSFYGKIYVGIPRIGLSWNCFRYDNKIRGPVVLTKSMLELYRLPELTKDVYPAPTGDIGGEALGGLYCWYPQAYCVNEEGARRCVIENLLGPYAYPVYKIWEDIMIAYATPVKKHISENVILSSLKFAKSLIAEIEKLQRNQKTLYLPTTSNILTESIISEMQKSTNSALLKYKQRKTKIAKQVEN